MFDFSHSMCGRAPGGCRLQDIVHGSMKWVLASNFMVDMTWLLSACPQLLQAHQLVIVHGERTPDRHGAIHIYMLQYMLLDPMQYYLHAKRGQLGRQH